MRAQVGPVSAEGEPTARLYGRCRIRRPRLAGEHARVSRDRNPQRVTTTVSAYTRARTL